MLIGALAGILPEYRTIKEIIHNMFPIRTGNMFFGDPSPLIVFVPVKPFDKIAAAFGHVAELAAAMRVVAQARRVQRQCHEALKADPAMGLGDFTPDQRRQVGG